ncbi:MAG: glycosyltransferase [Hyphomicrobiales bacterium]|nr:glycosyltransferase [Hyphomicrobiales bacterium]MCP4998605.1 glycosyltransferase [Hyphomicrobiales bacterium]
MRKLGFERKLTRARNADARALQLFSHVMVPTHIDCRRLGDLVGDKTADDKIRVVSNIAPNWALDHLTGGPEPLNGWGGSLKRLLFVGHLRYRPNVDAVDDLLHRIWPRLQMEFANLHLCIAGRDPKSRVKRWVKSAENVKLIGDPESLEEIYATCDAVIIPLRAGGGSRLKVLEALAVGKPVIASAKAVEGLELFDGKHWLRAETPADYVSAIRRLNDNPDLAGELAANGQALVKMRHCADALEASLRSVFSEILM